MKKMKFFKNGIRLVIDHHQGYYRFRSIVTHPMESGLRKNYKTGKLIPADYIKTLTVSVDGNLHYEALLSENVSTNPLFTFAFATPVYDGQKLEVRWKDNNGNETKHEATLDFTSGRFKYFANVQNRPTP